MGFTKPFEVITFPGTGTASMPGTSRISVIIPVRDDSAVPGRLCSGLKVYTRVRSGGTEVTEASPANGHTGHPKTVCRKAGPDVAGPKAHSTSVSWISKGHQTSAILGKRKIIPSRSIVAPTCGGQ